jgi:tetratricopeptide (TPR) repeat protein
MRRPVATLLALSLALAAAGCELLPPDPLAELEPPPPLPQPTTSWLDLGRQLMAADRPDEAHDAFIRSMRVEGITAAALTGAGVAAERRGLLTEARRYFEEARQRAPDSVTAHNNLGAVLYRLGELQDARDAFKAALVLSNGADQVAARNLGISEVALRRTDAAAARQVDGPELNPHRLERVGPAHYRLSEAGSRRTSSSSEMPPGPDRPALGAAPFPLAGLLQIQEDG